MSRVRAVPALFAGVLVVSVVNVGLALSRTEGPVPAPPSVERTYDAQSVPGPAGPAFAAAVTAVPLALTYDYRRVEEGLEEATRLMTPPFAREFRREFRRATLPTVRAGRVVTRATVRGAGLIRVEPSGVVVCLVYVDQSLVAGRGRPAGAVPEVVRRESLVVRMAQWDGSWRVGAIDTV